MAEALMESKAARIGRYTASMRRGGSWGGHVDMMLFEKLYKRPVYVFEWTRAGQPQNGCIYPSRWFHCTIPRDTKEAFGSPIYSPYPIPSLPQSLLHSSVVNRSFVEIPGGLVC